MDTIAQTFLAEIESFLDDESNLGIYFKDKYALSHTSGSQGQPLLLVQTKDNLELLFATLAGTSIPRTLFDKVRGTYNDNVTTFDMHMPTWPFFAVAWAGDVSAVLLIAIRTYRLIFHPELMKPVDEVSKSGE